MQSVTRLFHCTFASRIAQGRKKERSCTRTWAWRAWTWANESSESMCKGDKWTHVLWLYLQIKIVFLMLVYGKFTNISPIGSKCLKICQHHGACMRRLLIFLYNNMRVWFHVCCIIESKIKHLQHVMHLFDYFSSCLVRLNKAYVLASSWVGYHSHSLAFIDSYLRNDPCARRHWCLQGIITLSSQRWRMLKTRGSRHCTRSLAATCLANGMAKATCLAAS